MWNFRGVQEVFRELQGYSEEFQRDFRWGSKRSKGFNAFKRASQGDFREFYQASGSFEGFPEVYGVLRCVLRGFHGVSEGFRAFQFKGTSQACR